MPENCEISSQGELSRMMAKPVVVAALAVVALGTFNACTDVIPEPNQKVFEVISEPAKNVPVTVPEQK